MCFDRSNIHQVKSHISVSTGVPNDSTLLQIDQCKGHGSIHSPYLIPKNKSSSIYYMIKIAAH